MDDSFDDELFGDSSEQSEVPAENGSQEIDVKSIVSELNDEFALTIKSIIKDVMSSSSFSEGNVRDLVDAVSNRIGSNSSCGAELILTFLAEMSEMAWCEATKCIIRLFATVAIRMMKDNQMDVLWKIIQTHCDQTCFCILESIRLHGCLVIAECLRLVNEKAESERVSQQSEVGDLSCNSDGTPNEKLYLLIPRELIERWAKVLTQRRLDKSSNVRAIGVSAMSVLPHVDLVDFENNDFTPNDLVLESLRDVDIKVREAAIKSLSILSTDHIEETMNRLIAEEKAEIRRLLAAKLIQEVHVMSYSEEQRATFLSFLYKNTDRILSRMARERLIPKWEEEQDGDSTLNSLFNPTDEEPLKMYISTLFADDLKRSENAWEFVEIIKEENPEMICCENWERSVTRLTASELSYGVLLLECTFSVLREAGELSSCLTRLVPSLADVCRSLRNVSIGWLSGSDSDRQEEKLMVRILKLVGLFDRFDSDGMCEWESLLRYLILSLEVKPSKILIEVCMDQLTGVFGSDMGKMDKMREWAIDEMDRILFEEEKVTEDDSLKWRCSLIVHSLVKYLPTIDTKTCDLTARLMEETFASEWDMQRELNCIVMLTVGCLKKDWLDGTIMLMLKSALEMDVESVKIVCLRGLTDLISIHSPSIVASLLFPDWDEEVISRETKLYQLFDNYVDPTSKSILSMTALNCTLRLVREWTPPCPIFIYNLLLFTTRENKGEGEGLEKAVIEELKRCIRISKPFRLMVAHSMYCLIERQKGDSAYKCSIMSTLMKTTMLLKNEGREERKGEKKQSIDIEEWLVPMIVLDAVIEDPESGLNKVLVNSLGCMKKDDGGSGKKMIVKKMKTAIERLAIYDENSTSKALIKIVERMDLRTDRKRKSGEGKKRGRKRIKREEDEDTMMSDTTIQQEDEL